MKKNTLFGRPLVKGDNSEKHLFGRVLLRIREKIEKTPFMA